MRTSLVVVLALAALTLAIPAALGDSLAAGVNGARGSALPVRGEVDQTAQASASRQAQAQDMSHAALGHLSSICNAYGEVVGAGPSVDAIFELFRQSSSHWSTITDPRWTAMGTGIAEGSDGMLYVSVVFCQEAAPAPTTTTTTTTTPAPEDSEEAPEPAEDPVEQPEEPTEPQPAGTPETPVPSRSVAATPLAVTSDGVSISVVFGPTSALPPERWERSEDPTVT